MNYIVTREMILHYLNEPVKEFSYEFGFDLEDILNYVNNLDTIVESMNVEFDSDIKFSISEDKLYWSDEIKSIGKKFICADGRYYPLWDDVFEQKKDQDNFSMFLSPEHASMKNETIGFITCLEKAGTVTAQHYLRKYNYIQANTGCLIPGTLLSKVYPN